MKDKTIVFKIIYVILVMVFLYAPIAMLILFSFNSGATRAVFSGVSLIHYRELADQAELLGALRNTLIVASIASVVSTLLGTYAAFVIARLSPFKKNVVLKSLNIPMLNADIVTGISLMLFFVFISIPLGFFTLLIAHVMFNVPYVTMSVLPKIRQLNKSTYEAALDLGASPALAFRKVVLPEILPGVISGALLAFTLSLDDFIISYFTSGSDFMTLSVCINSMTKRSIPLAVNALSTILFIAVFLILVVVNFMPSRKNKGEQK